MTKQSALKDQIQDIYPLTPLQRGILFHTLFATNSTAYFEQLICRLDGIDDPTRLSGAFEQLTARHPILRTGFITKGQREPRQVVFNTCKVPLAVHDWRAHSETKCAAMFSKLLVEDRQRGFQLNRPPLMRLTMLRYGESEWRLIWSHHHILMDGWSLPILMRDYFALLGGTAALLPPVPRPFSDYVDWLGRQDATAAQHFWRTTLGDLQAPTPLGCDRPAIPGVVPGNDIGRLQRSIEFTQPSQHAPGSGFNLTIAAERCRISPSTLLLGAWAILLSRYSRQDDVVFGMTLSGRGIDLPGVDMMVGMLINSLPLRISVPGDAILQEWLAQVQSRQLSLQPMSHCDLAEIQGWSNVPRGQPLFESLVAIDNFPIGEQLQTSALDFDISEVWQEEHTHYPLTLVLVPSVDRLSIKLEFDRARIDPSVAQALFDAYQTVLQQCAARPQASIGELRLVDAAPAAIPEIAPDDDPATLADTFLGIVRRFPERIAVSDGDSKHSLTYLALAQAAIAVARHLRAHGVAPATPVGICLPRSYMQITAMLGVTLAGGIYVPLDPDYPPERLSYMLEDSAALLVLTSKDVQNVLPSASSRLLLEPLLANVSADDNIYDYAPPAKLHVEHGAYIIYTSGSTGQPKGVLVSQRNVIRLFAATESQFSFDQHDVWSYFHSFSFDFSVWELWGPLLSGGRAVVVPQHVSRDPGMFIELLGQESVTVLNQTPSAFKLLIAAEREKRLALPLALKWVIFGGEVLYLQDLLPWLQCHGDTNPQLINMYGITETTVHATWRRICAADLERDDLRGVSPIGAPLRDLTITLLDQYGHLVPIGATGEIHVGGPGLSHGYLNRSELNQARFPVIDGHRLYRSGDLARRLPDGDLLYCGRSDQQVKIRGFRIELGEVRAALQSHPKIVDVFVAALDDGLGSHHLVAYLVSSDDKPIAIDMLRQHMSAKLPLHMVPAFFVFLDVLPLTANGKINSKALPQPHACRSALEVPFVAAKTPQEKILSEIWQEVLALPRVGIHDNYFSLGGDSIRSIRIAGLAKERGCPVTIQDIFQHGTIYKILQSAATVDAVDASQIVDKPASHGIAAFALISASDRALLPASIEDALPLARLQAGMLFHSEYGDGRNLYHDVMSHRIRYRMDESMVSDGLAELFQEHPILRTEFALAGYSQPLQLVRRAVIPLIEFEDLRLASPEMQEAAIARKIATQGVKLFDPQQAPLLRLHCQRLADDVWQVTIVVHHAILDGWSLATLCAQFLRKILDSEKKPPRPQTTYRDFIAAEQTSLQSHADRDFWQSQLHDLPATVVPRWSTLEKPQGVQRSGRLDAQLDQAVSQGLLRLSKESGYPVKSLMLALHVRVLNYLSGTQEVVTGLVTNGRPSDVDGANTLGLFLNTLPLRLRVEAGSWRNLIDAVMIAEGASLPHRHFPMAEIRKMNGNRKLFETSFNYVDFHVYKEVMDNKELELLGSAGIEVFDIPFSVSFGINQQNGQVTFSLSYDKATFPQAQAEAIVAIYLRAATALLANPDANCQDSILADPAQIDWLIASQGQGAAATIGAPSVPHAVAEIASRMPDAIAVQSVSGSLTFAQLDSAANRLAHHLIANGVGIDIPVAVAFDRSLELVVAMLAVLRAGGAYVPLDPALPSERLNNIVEDVKPPLILSARCFEFILSGVVASAVAGPVRVIYLEQAARALAQLPASAPQIELPPDALAYILFTSGSSGRPKGVAISHASLSNHMAWMKRQFPLCTSDVVLQKTPIGFDASIWEFWAPLMEGAQLLLAADGGHQDPDYLIRAIREQRVSVLQVVPSLLAVLLSMPEFSACGSLRRVFSGGERLSSSTIARFQSAFDIPLVNLYGPTESTIDASSAEFGKTAAAVSIGMPIDGVSFYVLDQRLNPLPVGVCGELYIGGIGLARGYWERRGLTAQRFLPDHLSALPGNRLYRSGDIVRWLSDGGIEYIGRADGQIKLHGQRVEIGEIEALLDQYAPLLHAAVNAYQNSAGATRLVAYVQLQEPARAADWQESICAYLRQSLPEYMIPTLWIDVAQWPLTANGKTDRSALPDPNTNAAQTEPHPYRVPLSTRELELASIWQRVLQCPQVGLDDNFFALGGDSILGLQIVAQARQVGLTFTPRQLFQYPTIAELAGVVRQAEQLTVEAPIGVNQRIPLTPQQSWFFEQIENMAKPEHWNQSVLLSVSAKIQPHMLRSALLRLISAHDVFRLRFHRDAQGWFQTYAAPDSEGNNTDDTAENPCWLESVDLSLLAPTAVLTAAITAQAEQAQRSLNLEHGPLLRVIHFNLGATMPGRILVVIHHLIVDGVAWRVLLQDLAAILAGQTPVSPASSFAHWALSQSRRYPDAAERAYWQRQAGMLDRAGRIPTSFDLSTQNRYGVTGTVEVTLDQTATLALLKNASGYLKASTVEILLASALGAIHQWHGHDTLALTLEGHGRGDGGGNDSTADNSTGRFQKSDAQEQQYDVSHTVGWFTALYPIAIEGMANIDMPLRLRLVKKAMREIPNGGSGYGLLRYRSADVDTDALRLARSPQIAFNYLGQFDGSLPDDGALAMADEPIGAMEDPAGQRPHLLDIVALVSAGRLTIRWVYGTQLHQRDVIEKLAQAMLHNIDTLLALDAKSAAATWLPSDYPLASLSTETLTQVVDGRDDILDIWNLTPVQEGMLFHSRLEEKDGHAAVYIEQVVAEIASAIDPDLLAQAWTQVLARHDALRATFVWQGLVAPQQRIHAPLPIPFAIVELEPVTDNEAQAGVKAATTQTSAQALAGFLAQDRAAGFNLQVPPLMRVTLLTLGGKPWRLVWTHHHALLDGWSMAIVFGEVMVIYRALSSGTSLSLPPAPSFGRFIQWLQRGETPEKQAIFWRDYFEGFEASIDLGLSPALPQSQVLVRHMQLDRILIEALQNQARSYSVTINTMFQAAFALALSRFSNTRDVTFGVTVSGRPAELAGIGSIVGLFIATLPLRAVCVGSSPLGAFLRQLQDTHSRMTPFEASRLVDIQRWSGFPANRPLFDAVMVYENYPVAEEVGRFAEDLRIGAAEAHEQSNYPLMLYVKPGPNGTELNCSFDANRIGTARIEILLALIGNLVNQLAQGSTQYLGELLPSPVRTVQQQPSSPHWDQGSVLQMIERAAQRYPDKTAVIGDDGILNYRQLIARARYLAGKFAQHGVQPGHTVAVALATGANAVSVLLGVLWAGAQYLPLDTTQPTERLAAILGSAQPRLIVFASGEDLVLPAKIPSLLMDMESIQDSHHAEAMANAEAGTALPGDRLCPESAAYTIFTSGSTGNPKGVQIAHRSLSNILQHFGQEPGISSDDILLSATTLSFDIAALELFQPLVSGATLVVAAPALSRDGISMVQTLGKYAVSVLQATPATWRMLLAASWQPTPGFRAWCGGEALPADLAQELLALGVELWNVYGPTETTIWSALHRVSASDLPPPIGHPIRNTYLYVIDQDGNQMPPGLSGELLIGGDGLAQCYLNDPRQTAARFRPDPFVDEGGARVYYTGDLASRDVDGNLALQGRIDAQVKVNGFRIELGEVETQLRRLPGIREAAAAVKADTKGIARLVAYLVLESDAEQSGAVAPATLLEFRQRLGASLPTYMLPSFFLTLKALPLTLNRKLDRKALPTLGALNLIDKREQRNALEEAVCAIWSDIFGHTEVHADDDFFAIGGHSLLATQIHVRIDKIFNMTLPLRAIFTALTPRSLAEQIVTHETTAGSSEKIASAYLKLRHMTDQERAELRQSAARNRKIITEKVE